ncbi:MAG: GNAT family N-acetyltransferase [Clostridia bacterium]|nr:GNAT family N-acetyltransferase [Clostridia bacterium]
MIKQLTVAHTQQFCDLIVDMYSDLENLEWFSPMPYDYDNVKSMIENPRFYIIGYFDGDTLCAVSSLDYKCGKLIGKVDFPKECDTTNLVEIGFTMVHSKYKGNGIMKKMVAHLLQKIKDDGFEWAFGKVHKNNLASSKSLLKNDFKIFSEYKKPVSVADFKALSSQDFFSQIGKQNAEKTLSNINADAQDIIVEYYIIVKKL